MNERSYLSSVTNGQLLVPLFLVFLVIASLATNLSVLFRYDVPLGVDGYYYILQIENFLSYGFLYFPTWFFFPSFSVFFVSLLSFKPYAMAFHSLFLHIITSISLFLSLFLSPSNCESLFMCIVCVFSSHHLLLQSIIFIL